MSFDYLCVAASSTTITHSNQSIVNHRSSFTRYSVVCGEDNTELEETIERIELLSLSFVSSLSRSELSAATDRQEKLWDKWKKDVCALAEDTCLTFQSRLATVLKKFDQFASPENNGLMSNFISDLERRTLSEVNHKYFNPLSLKREEWKLPWWSDVFELFTSVHSGVGTLIAKDINEIGAQLLAREVKEQPIIRDRLLKLLVHRKEQKNPSFYGYVMGEDEMADFLRVVQLTQGKKLPDRMHLLVRSEVHYTTITIERNKGKWTGAVLDAAADKRAKGLALKLKESGIEDILLVSLKDRIQYDMYNCAFFALEVAKAMHKVGGIAQLKTHIKPEKGEDGIEYCLWIDMPPMFAQFTTSTSFIKSYLEKHPDLHSGIFKGKLSFSEYMKGLKGRIVINEGIKDAYVKIPEKVERCEEKVEMELDHYSSEELDTIVNTQSTLKLLHEVA